MSNIYIYDDDDATAWNKQQQQQIHGYKYV